MKAITIKQPFASLIASGIKAYEFRTWKTTYRGEVLILAGKSVDESAMERFGDYDLEYPLGCVIARAESRRSKENSHGCLPDVWTNRAECGMMQRSKWRNEDAEASACHP